MNGTFTSDVFLDDGTTKIGEGGGNPERRTALRLSTGAAVGIGTRGERRSTTVRA